MPQRRSELTIAEAIARPPSAVVVDLCCGTVHEPRAALDGGRDGLAIQRRVAAEAGEWLSPGGPPAHRDGQHQAATTAEIVAGGGLDTQVVHDDELEATVVIGGRPTGAAYGRR